MSTRLPDPEYNLPTLTVTPTPPPSRGTKLWLAWQKYRNVIRAPISEFLGVAIFVVIGAGADCSVVLSTKEQVSDMRKGEYLSTNLGWAIGLALGVWTCLGISGGHVNPAITLVMATRRGFSWRKVPFYLFAQVMGGIVGAALVYSQYIHAIDLFEGGRHVRTQDTGGLFASFALPYMTQVSCFFSEFLGTAILAFMIIAGTDQNNASPPLVILPFLIFLTMLGLSIALGMQTAFCFNPARDFGPRLFLSMAGYGKEVYTFRNQYWLWCMILAPILGAQCSAALYDFFLYDGARKNVEPPIDIDAPPTSTERPKFMTFKA